jgi:hypothetical protein
MKKLSDRLRDKLGYPYKSFTDTDFLIMYDAINEIIDVVNKLKKPDGPLEAKLKELGRDD